MHKTSIIILTYNNLEYTKLCLESIEKYTDKNQYELIIIDNASTDGTKEYLKTKNNIKVIYNTENRGFPIGCNQGIELANKKNDICLLNNDVIVTPNWLENLQKSLYSKRTIGAVGPVCNNFENNQGCFLEYNGLEELENAAKKHNISNPAAWEEKNFLIGFCLLIKRSIINKLQKLDEMYTPGYIEDNDLSLRIICLGYKLLLCHDVYIHHYLGTTFRKDLTKFYPVLYKNRDYFQCKWGFSTVLFDEIKYYQLPLLNNPQKLLDVNSKIGTNALYIKFTYSIKTVHGLEENEYQNYICQKVIPTYQDLNKLTATPRQKYDCILLPDDYSITKNNEILKILAKHLRENGYIIGTITPQISQTETTIDTLKFYFNNLNLQLDKIIYWQNDNIINSQNLTNITKISYRFKTSSKP